MPSIRSHLWRLLLQARTDWSRPLPEQRRRIDADAAWIKPPAGIEIEAHDAGGVRGEWLIPPDASLRRCVLYLHGGTYCTGSIASHRALAARIAKASGAGVFLLDYRLAPESPFPAALDDAKAALRWLQGDACAAGDIAIAGDGAGGGLALATMVALRDAGEALPGLAVLISPWVDLTCSGATIKSKAASDPRLTAQALEQRRLYAGAADLADPMLSPLFADLAGLPPLLLHAGTDEMLLSDATRLARKARDARVDVELRIWSDLWHVFHAFGPYLPEAAAALGDIGAFVHNGGHRRVARHAQAAFGAPQRLGHAPVPGAAGWRGRSVASTETPHAFDNIVRQPANATMTTSR